MSDIKLALRRLLKSPGFTAIAVLTLALGIGVNTSIFTALQAFIARSLPYPDGDSLVQLFQTSTRSAREPHHSVANFLDYQARSPVFQYLAAWNDKAFNLADPGEPAERVRGLQVSADLFPLLGVPPALGRVFTREEDRPGGNNVVILDYGFWLRRFASDTNIIGRVLRLDGESVTVIGVMPERFHDPLLMGPVDLWRPIAFTDEQRRNRGMNFLKCIARLKPGTSLPDARSATQVMAARLAQDNPENSADGLLIVPLANSSLPPQAGYVVWSVMALAGFVLLIACANLANLQFARTAARGRELAIRGALGAPRGRVIRQLLTESLLVALFGGSLGLLFGHWSNELLSWQFSVDGETVLHLPVNLKVAGFALAAALASALAFGLVPALLGSRFDLNQALKQGSRGSTADRSQHRLQHSLIIVEVALAMMLLAGAGLVVNGLKNFAAINPGWQIDGMSLGYLTLPERKYPDDNSLRRFAEALESKLSALPGVQHVALGWNLPIRQFNVTSTLNLDELPRPAKGFAPDRSVNAVTPGYFKTMGMQFEAGRDFNSSDTVHKPDVVIINRAMARAFWPDKSPIGQHIGQEEIVGVVNDVTFPANPAQVHTGYQTYRPFAQSPGHSFTMAVRGTITAATLRRVVAEIDPDQPVGNPGPVRADIGKTLEMWAIGGRLLGVFAALGLLLAALGIYGVISGFVVRRTGEIGVRMALGAQLADVLWLVIAKGWRLAITGTLIGVLGAVGLSRVLGALLPLLPPSNPLVIFVVGLILQAIALLACWIPARRAAGVDPLIALRNE